VQLVTELSAALAGRRSAVCDATTPGACPETTLMNTLVETSVGTIGAILGVMAIMAVIEAVIPLRKRERWGRAHLAPNLILTFITFATNIVFNTALVLALFWLEANGLGLLNTMAIEPLWAIVAAVVILDFSFYVAHVAMHKIPGFWRYHAVHHSDPAVDVTTTVRQHPGESVIRYAFLALFAIPLGVGPAGFAVYRIWSALNGLLEHSNIRVPRWLDTPLSLVTTFPNMHKVHHSRDQRLTDTNYGNIFSLWDRIFFTFTPSKYGTNVDYGLDGLDDKTDQTTWGLLATPYRLRARRDATDEGATT
jgi:sterol desaturase/sphingolipid hydroxylase (fatty acid hydroxylase superfamily)